MKLYGFPPSPNTWKVRAVAAHLGLTFELEFVDLTKGQSHTPAYLALNPTGRTPVLVDGDFKLWESTAIMQYLASQTPNRLWPDDRPRPRRHHALAKLAARALGQGGLRAADLRAAGQEVPELGRARRRGPGQGHRGFNREARVLDAHLGKQPYLVGQEPTLADFSVAAPLFYAKEAELPLAPYAHVRIGSSACRRCRPGGRRRRRRLPLRHERRRQ